MRYIVSQETIADKAIEIMADINEHIAKGLSVVEVRKYDKQKEISLAQMAYIHCENGPIKMYAKEHGYSSLEAELILKRECGEHLFIHELKGDNWFKMMEKLGAAYFECLNPMCRRLTYPDKIKKIDMVRICPNCNTKHPRIIFILSKTELTTKQTTEWIENMYNWLRDMHNIQVELPDQEWRSK